MKILKILRESEWGSSPLQRRILGKKAKSVVREYTYFDYKTAWEKLWLVQNKAFTHSRFIKISLKESMNSFPNWFRRWFQFWGITVESFPDQLKEFWTSYEDPLFRGGEDSDVILLKFVLKYSIPWIIQWRYETDLITPDGAISLPSLFREVHVKFWDKFDLNWVLESQDRDVNIPVPAPSVPSIDHPQIMALASELSSIIQARDDFFPSKSKGIIIRDRNKMSQLDCKNKEPVTMHDLKEFKVFWDKMESLEKKLKIFEDSASQATPSEKAESSKGKAKMEVDSDSTLPPSDDDYTPLKE